MPSLYQLFVVGVGWVLAVGGGVALALAYRDGWQQVMKVGAVCVGIGVVLVLSGYAIF
jgi:hypothetical protein